MSRDVSRDGLAVGRLLSTFERESTEMQGCLIKPESVESRRTRVQEFKAQHPGLDIEYVEMLDGAVESLVRAFRTQRQPRGHG